MSVIGFILSLALILLTIVDAFEAILQPRRVTHRFRYARFFYRNAWAFWRALALRIPAGKRREAFLSVFGPVSLLGLFASWVMALIVGFGLLHWSLGTVLLPDGGTGLPAYLYLSGTTFFTLGYGDITPAGPCGRILAVAESGFGFGFLAVIIGYLPVLFQAFSRREVTISLLDARAGSPPSAAQVVLRLARSGCLDRVNVFLAEWELWAAELLESHLSFPLLSYFRSQHDNQSWLAALTTILDACAFLIAEVKDGDLYRAQLTFAMARHAAVDLALVLRTPPEALDPDRLPPARLKDLRESLQTAGVELHEAAVADPKLAELRELYEPFVTALARRFLFTLPVFVPDEPSVDNWQRSAWTKRTAGIGSLPATGAGDEHFV